VKRFSKAAVGVRGNLNQLTQYIANITGQLIGGQQHFGLGPLLVGLYGNYYGHRFSSSRFIDGTFDCIDSAVSHLLFTALVTAAAGSSFGGINHYFFASLDLCSAQLAGSRELRVVKSHSSERDRQ
jgi:hypothetical protein